MPKLDRTALKGRAQTVLGVVDPAVLGPTLMHEHVICDITPQKYVAEPVEDQEIDICNCWQINFGQKLSGLKWKLNQPDIVTSELREMVAAGGRTVVELTSGGLKPDPKALVDISQKSGAHLVMGCGHYVNDYQDRRNHERGVDEFAAEMVAQVFEFGQENSYYVHSDIDMPNDAVRLRLIRALINHGHLDRVVISHDICYRTRLTRYGGHGYQHIFANVIPMMRRRGYSETEIDTIMVRTPKRLLTFV
jgi:predicted metal-dependent phosphotriesterase family hydrolase